MQNRIINLMKKLYLFSIVLLVSFASHAGTVSSIKGDCYQATMGFGNPEYKNILTICINDGRVNERFILPNKGHIPTVCYQSGDVEESKNNAVTLTYSSGYCDNDRPYKNQPYSCILDPQKSLKCKDGTEELKLDYLKR